MINIHSVQFKFVCLFVFLFTQIAHAENQSNDQGSLIAPISSTPYGQTYGHWAAQWEQWAFAIPAVESPLTDNTGEFCAQRQVDKVWFLVGSREDIPIKRTCQVPAGKALFFPLINTGYGAFLNDPADQRTEQFVRNAGSCTEPAIISVSIDGRKIDNPNQYFTGASGSQSPIFNIQMAPGNLFGDTSLIPELVLSPSSEQGYYLFINPLGPGKHTIHWVADGCASTTPHQDVTYVLTIVGSDSLHK